MTDIARNIAGVRERIAQAARRAERPPDAVTLMAVGKTVDASRLAQAYAAGVRDFGESYAQEALAKLEFYHREAPDAKRHFIGRLQRNKVRYVVGEFSLIHSADDLELAQEIGKRSLLAQTTTDILLEVRLDAETETKFGVPPEETLKLAAQVAEIAGVRLCGLMGMAPFSDNPENARPHFRRLRALFDQLPSPARQTLSMGMSGDFEVAVEEGATLVRIGTALFGTRP